MYRWQAFSLQQASLPQGEKMSETSYYDGHFLKNHGIHLSVVAILTREHLKLVPPEIGEVNVLRNLIR